MIKTVLKCFGLSKHVRYHKLLVFCSVLFFALWLMMMFVNSDKNGQSGFDPFMLSLYSVMPSLWMVSAFSSLQFSKLFCSSTHYKLMQTKVIPIMFTVFMILTTLLQLLLGSLLFNPASVSLLILVSSFVSIFFELFSILCYKFYISSLIVFFTIYGGLLVTGVLEKIIDYVSSFTIDLLPAAAISFAVIVVGGFISYVVSLLVYKLPYSPSAMKVAQRNGYI